MREGVKAHPFAFPRAERLPNKREAEILFRQGTRLFSFPYRALYRVGAEGEPGIKTVFIAPKRLCKLSVERHAHKRRMREAYRLQAMGLRQICAQRNLHLTIAVIVVDCELPTFQKSLAAMGRILRKIEEGIDAAGEVGGA